jgi:histidine triad (HIT) family protein
VIVAARRVSAAVKEAVGVHAMQLRHASGAEAGQEVFHFHLHVVPRRSGDGVQRAWGLPPRGSPALGDDRLDEIADAIRAKLEWR